MQKKVLGEALERIPSINLRQFFPATSKGSSFEVFRGILLLHLVKSNHEQVLEGDCKISKSKQVLSLPEGEMDISGFSCGKLGER